MSTYLFSRTFPQAIIQPLVVSELEPQLLHPPFHVPVDFRQPHEGRYCRQCLLPELGFWHRPRVQETLPRPIENFIRDEHRHVAAHPIAKLRDVFQNPDHGLTTGGIEIIELCDVRPWRKIRIATASDEQILTALPFHQIKSCGIASKVLFAALDVAVSMLHHPGMVEAGVVRHKVENQSHASTSQLVVHFAQAFSSRNTGVGTIVLNRKRRTNYVPCFPTRQCGIEIAKIPRIRAKNSPPNQTSPPHAHQVHKIESQICQTIPFFARYVPETQAPAVLGRKFF